MVLSPQRPAQPPSGEGVRLPKLGALGTARFVWRQLTSMRTALLLLMLLAVAAVPGSVFPQYRINPGAVDSYVVQNPTVGPWLERLGFFDVYSSPWFSAVYLLLFISLVGCVLPRSRQHWVALRTGPTITPRVLSRMPQHRRVELDEPAGVVLGKAREVLRRKRFRTAHRGSDPLAVSAERGYLAETGNLVFHLSLLGLLLAIALGSFFSYGGQVLLVTGQTFVNSVPDYDSFTPGRAVDESHLAPFQFRLDSLDVRFEDQAGGSQFGAPRDFTAQVSLRRTPEADLEPRTVRVNQPLDLDGAKAFLVGNGYAPVLTVRDGEGTAVSSSAVPFLPEDGNYTSNGVVKAPDARPRQLGLVGVFLPTAQATERGVVSVFPDALNPRLIFTAFTGDLGLDDGTPQSVYALDAENLTQLTVDGAEFSAILAPGQSVDLPGGGSVRFDGLRRFAAFDIRHDPTTGWVLGASVLALTGLTVSLFVPRRRVWVRAEVDPAGRTVVQVAGLSRRGGDSGLGPEVDAVLAHIVKEQH